MNKRDLNNKVVSYIERKRIDEELSQKQMADELGMSLSGYKKMVSGNTEKIDLYLLYKCIYMSDKDIDMIISFMMLKGKQKDLIYNAIETLSDKNIR